MALIPRYVEGHNLLANKSILITAAAGAGIGFAAARKCVEEGCRALFISDIHEGRTAQAVEALKALGGTQQVFGLVANVTDEAAGAGVGECGRGEARRRGRADQQRRARRHEGAHRDDATRSGTACSTSRSPAPCA
jgi:NAD(P)-dependent dehydrogenase (short-subunit alcohol dehydrogenase family)